MQPKSSQTEMTMLAYWNWQRSIERGGVIDSSGFDGGVDLVKVNVNHAGRCGCQGVGRHRINSGEVAAGIRGGR